MNKALKRFPVIRFVTQRKMAHGHIQALIDAQVPIIFYPGVVFLNSKKQWKRIIILIVQLCKATQMSFEIMWMPSERAK